MREKLAASFAKRCVAVVVAAIVVSLDTTEPARAGAEVDRYVGVVADGSARSDIEATLEIRPIGPRDRLLVIRETRAGTAIVAYDDDPALPSPMHLLAVSSDLRSFVPLRPQLDAAGDFTVIFNAPRAGSYVLYAVATPQGLGERAFRFDVPITIGEFSGTARANSKRDEASRPPMLPSLVARVDGYVVTLAPASERLQARTTLDTKGHTIITATVRRGGKRPPDFSIDGHDADDLINVTTLRYFGVHAIPADFVRTMCGFQRRIVRVRPPGSPQHDAKGTLVVGPLVAGTYALAFRFHAERADHIATFFIDAR